MPLSRMHDAYFSNASCVLTGVEVSAGVVPLVEPSEATCAEALPPVPHAVARRAIDTPRRAIDCRGCIRMFTTRC